jgi:hypothetical protein
MRATEEMATVSDRLDWARIERTLRVSIKLMKRGQREIQRLRDRDAAQVRPDRAGDDAE